MNIEQVSAQGFAPVAAEKTVEKPAVLQSLRQQLARLERLGNNVPEDRISSGAALFDAMLPGRGLAAGSMHEWVEHEEGSLAGWLALLSARSALLGWDRRHHGRLVVLDREGTFYPPAAQALGIPLERLVLIRPKDHDELIWSADQALRSPVVSAVWGRLETLDDRDARRLQLAAEVGGSLGLWVRPQRALSQPSWADVRWYVRSLPPLPRTATGSSAASIAATSIAATSIAAASIAATERGSKRMELRLVRCRGGRSGASAIFEINSHGQICHEPTPQQSPAMPLVAQLAHPKSASKPRQRSA